MALQTRDASAILAEGGLDDSNPGWNDFINSLSRRHMRNQTGVQNSSTSLLGYSNRILSLALIGIVFLTLYPFQISSHVVHQIVSSPFLLGGEGKDAGFRNSFLNVLLFIPFGFGLAERLRERGKSRVAALFLCLLAGALLSYTIEFLQLYIPTRDSGWDDILTNSTGSVLGCLLFVWIGARLVRPLAGVETELRNSLTMARGILLISIYFAAWFGISASLQMQTRISGWNPQSLLVVGNDAIGRPAATWKGDVSQLDIWDHALPAGTARKITAGESPASAGATPAAAYVLLAPPFEDRFRFLAALSWAGNAAPRANSTADVALDGSSWLVSNTPVTNLVADFQKNNQFAIRVICKPAETAGVDGRIVSISSRSGRSDLQIQQEDSSLVFWFRTPLVNGPAALPWDIPNVFAAGRQRDILFSYDGSAASLYIDGSSHPRQYRLGPSAVLAHYFRRMKPSELSGYSDIYYFFVFFPGGALLGMASQPMHVRRMAGFLFPALALVIPAVLLQYTLALVGNRSASLRGAAFSILLSAVGWFWINSDSRKSAGLPD